MEKEENNPTKTPENKEDTTEEKIQLMSKKNKYISIRMLELVFGAAFFFGIMWTGVGEIELSVPEFLTLYGGAGALICEILARRINPNVSYEGEG